VFGEDTGRRLSNVVLLGNLDVTSHHVVVTIYVCRLRSALFCAGRKDRWKGSGCTGI
jgi:hypothetical protein